MSMRLILAEDSTLLRDGLSRMLQDEGHEVVGSFGDAIGLLDAVDALRPSVVVLDVRMPPTHTDEGMRAALAIRERFEDVGVLVLSQYVERRYALQLLGANAERVGYLLKDRVAEVGEFLDALRRIDHGGAVIDPLVVKRLLENGTSDPLAQLTAREREVLELMAEGMTNNTIASRLFVSRSAVEKHVNAIFDKLRIPQDQSYNRRILAVVSLLAGRTP